MTPPPPPPAHTAAPSPASVQQVNARLDVAWDWSVLVVSALVIAASVVLSPTSEAVSLFGVRIPELCTIRRLTGLSCPGCGLTRSFTFMGHGQIVQAFQMHLLGPVLYLAVLAQLPLRVRSRWRGRAVR